MILFCMGTAPHICSSVSPIRGSRTSALIRLSVVAAPVVRIDAATPGHGLLAHRGTTAAESNPQQVRGIGADCAVILACLVQCSLYGGPGLIGENCLPANRQPVSIPDYLRVGEYAALENRRAEDHGQGLGTPEALACTGRDAPCCQVEADRARRLASNDPGGNLTHDGSRGRVRNQFPAPTS